MGAVIMRQLGWLFFFCGLQRLIIRFIKILNETCFETTVLKRLHL